MRRALVCLAALAALLAWPGAAFAHAELETADPTPGARVAQAPPSLRLSFSEPVDASFSRVQVLDAQKQEVDRGDSHVLAGDPRAMQVSLPSGLPDGIYTVAWRTLSAADGHTVNGAYPILVGNVAAGAQAPPASTSESDFSPETAAGRWLFYLAASAVFGSLLAWKLVFAPLLRGPNAAARRSGAARMRALLLVAGTLLVVATLYGALAQAASAANVSLLAAVAGPLPSILMRGRFAVIWWPRLALVLAAVALLRWQDLDDWGGDLALAVLPGVLLTSSLTSHGAALASGPYLGVAVDWLHLMAVGAWVGGLASLVVVLPAITAPNGPAATAGSRVGDRVLGPAIRRFSGLAIGSVVVIALTGTFQTWLEVGTWDGLLQTAYGHSVLAKIGLMLLMLLGAAYNLLVAGPRLVGRAGSALGAAAVLAARFRLAVRVELALGLVVLGIAAVLTGLTPGREQLAIQASGASRAGPVDRPVDASGLPVRVGVTPAAVGINQFTVRIDGADPATYERVQLTLTFLDAELGSQPLVLQYQPASSPPTWGAESPALSQAGNWQAELLIRRTGQDDARSAVRFLVTGPGVAPPPTASATYPLLPSPLTAAAYGLVLAGLAVIVGALLRGGRRVYRTQAALLGAGLVITLCGGYVYAQEQRGGVPLDVANIRNPVPPDDRSLADGARVYQTSCAVCHGDTGRGDGPGGIRLVPRPADLRAHMAAGHTDGQLFYWVTYGVSGTGMPAWQDGLTEQQRWDVINYIRTFATQ